MANTVIYPNAMVILAISKTALLWLFRKSEINTTVFRSYIPCAGHIFYKHGNDEPGEAYSENTFGNISNPHPVCSSWKQMNGKNCWKLYNNHMSMEIIPSSEKNFKSSLDNLIIFTHYKIHLGTWKHLKENHSFHAVTMPAWQKPLDTQYSWLHDWITRHKRFSSI